MPHGDELEGNKPDAMFHFQSKIDHTTRMINLVKVFSHTSLLFELCRARYSNDRLEFGWFVRIIPANVNRPFNYSEALMVLFRLKGIDKNYNLVLNNDEKTKELVKIEVNSSNYKKQLVIYGLNQILPILRELNSAYSNSIKIDTFEKAMKRRFVNSTFQRIVS